MPTSAQAPGSVPGMQHSGRPDNVRRVTEFIIVAICTIVFVINAVGICTTLLTTNYIGDRDFVSYWASGYQLARHANPYDSHAVLQLEQAVGVHQDLPALMMRNPPTSLCLVLPIGFLSVRSASLLWSFLMLGALVISVRIIAAMHNSSKSQLNILAYTFAPVLSCLIAGQMAIFVLLGLVIFLRLYDSRPFLAGAALWLCTLKPHLFLPLAVVMLAWILVSRRYRVFGGAAIAFAISNAVAVFMDPSVWSHYLHAMKAERIDTQIIPCVSMVLRMLVSPASLWLQFLPAVVGSIWAFLYFLKHRNDWDWLKHGSLILLVSVLVAPYSWFMDQTVLLPALLPALYKNRSHNLVAIFALLSAATESGNFMSLNLRNYALYVWSAPAWLAWYLCATAMSRSVSNSSQTSEEAHLEATAVQLSPGGTPSPGTSEV